MLQFAFILLLLAGSDALAQQAGDTRANEANWYVQAGAYVHYNNNDDYSGAPLFAGMEYQGADNWLAGLSLFNNSYDQFTQYLYLGKELHPWKSHPEVRIKLSAGVAQGYRGEHNDTLPIRWGGSWGLGFVP